MPDTIGCLTVDPSSPLGHVSVAAVPRKGRAGCFGLTLAIGWGMLASYCDADTGVSRTSGLWSLARIQDKSSMFFHPVFLIRCWL